MIPELKVMMGDCRRLLPEMAAEGVQCCVTSPPYFLLRDYGVDGQIGIEESPDEYVSELVKVFREVRRVLKKDGTLWLNLGDSYAGSGKSGNSPGREHTKQAASRGTLMAQTLRDARKTKHAGEDRNFGLKPKDLIGIPWMVAFALRADGWWLRSDIIWSKSCCMPESVTDRPTRSHEYIFLLTKSAHYFYDQEAIKEPCIYGVDGTGTAAGKARGREGLKSHPTAERNGIRPGGFKDAKKVDGMNGKQRGHSRRHDGLSDRWDGMGREEQCAGMRNKRDIWHVAPSNFREAHFATFPPDLIKPCILAGSRAGDTVLDPFAGSFTTCMVALEYGRKAIGVELNPAYVEMGKRRCSVTPGFALI